MPVYEYACPPHGVFSLSRPMAESGTPATCPRCGGLAPRIMSAVALGGVPRGRRRRGIPEPRLETRTREPPKPTTQGLDRRDTAKAHGHGRPWMMGH